MFQLTPIATALFITTVINIAVSYISWQRRKTKGGTCFSLGISGITLWTLASALDYAAVPIHLKVFFATAEAVGYHSAFALFAWFSVLYAGNERWLKKTWLKVLLFLLPFTNILLTITNELHKSLWTGFIRKANNVVVFEHGPAFSWVVIADYLLIIFIFANLWMASRKGSDITRRQARILMLALLFPIAINLLYRLGAGGIEGVDWTSITFSISGVLFLYALYGIRLLDIVPIARDKLISSLGDGMIVIDLQNRIVDINQIAAQNLRGQVSDLIGKNLADVVPLARSVLSQPVEDEQKIELESAEEDKQYFDVLISPLYEQGSEKVIGRLIISREITKRKLSEKTLEQRLSEIQRLNQELQESQTQLVYKQRALAKMEERQRMGRDLHDSVNQSVYSLMLFSETLISLLEREETQKAIHIAERIHENVQQALKEIRLLVYEATPQIFDQDTNPAEILQGRLNMVENRVGIKTEVLCEEETVINLPVAWKENLYWIMIEALNNSLKYSQAKKIGIACSKERGEFSMEVNDDGIGFDPSQVRSGGIGMRTMRERAELLGGELRIVSSRGGGTRVQFKVKLER